MAEPIAVADVLTGAAGLNNMQGRTMTKHWLRTDEHEEAVSALESVAEWLHRVERQLGHWRWVVLALHNAVQGFMVLALRGSNGLRPLRDDLAEAWLKAYREGGQYPVEKLDSFLHLYKKIKSDRMLFYMHSRKFTPTGSQGRSIKKLHSLRNDFIHFLPRSWAIEVSGLPEICLDCLEIIEFLAWESGNIFWHNQNLKTRTENALEDAKVALQHLDSLYAGGVA